MFTMYALPRSSSCNCMLLYEVYSLRGVFVPVVGCILEGCENANVFELSW